MTAPQPPTPTAAVTPWTRAQLIAQLRAAGWQRIAGPASVYRSPSGVLFNLDEYKAPAGILWRVYAALRTLPAAGAFSHDPDIRQRVRRAIEQREQRELKRREKQRDKNRPAANSGHKPML